MIPLFIGWPQLQYECHMPSSIYHETWKLQMNRKQPDEVSTHGAQLTQAERCRMKSSWTVEAVSTGSLRSVRNRNFPAAWDQHRKVWMGSFSYLLSFENLDHHPTQDSQLSTCDERLFYSTS